MSDRSVIKRAAHYVFGHPAWPAAVAHPETGLSSLPDMTADWRFRRPYRQTFGGFRNLIDDDHFALLSAPLNPDNNQMIDIGFDGWLLPADAAKLYEMAYFSNGPILELGTYRGLSASVIARAITKCGPAARLTTIDIDGSHVKVAEAAFEANKVPCSRVTFMVADAVAQVATFAAERQTFAFVFVDHSHAYEHMLPTCQKLAEIVEPGGFVLFHDYNDPRNATDEWGVYRAVNETLPGDFDFYGVYGCTGLFRRR